MTIIILQSFNVAAAVAAFTAAGFASFKVRGTLIEFSNPREFNQAGLELALANPPVPFKASEGGTLFEERHPDFRVIPSGGSFGPGRRG